MSTAYNTRQLWYVVASLTQLCILLGTTISPTSISLSKKTMESKRNAIPMACPLRSFTLLLLGRWTTSTV